MQTKYEVGKPFPGVYPVQAGPIMEVGPGGGFYLLIQFPNSTRQERQAFKKGFKRYGYLETSTPVPTAVWVFDFADPFGKIDISFNARPVPEDRIQAFMEPEEGLIKNALQVVLLDGNIITGLKLAGLQSEAVRLFHGTIRKQLSANCSQNDYNRCLTDIYKYSSEELFKMGTIFRHGK